MTDEELRVRVYDICDNLKVDEPYRKGLGCEIILNVREKRGIEWQRIHAAVEQWTQDRTVKSNEFLRMGWWKKLKSRFL